MNHLILLSVFISVGLLISCENESDTIVIENDGEINIKRLKEIHCDDGGIKNKTIFNYSSDDELENCEIYGNTDHGWDKHYEYIFTSSTNEIHMVLNNYTNYHPTLYKSTLQFKNDSILVSKTRYYFEDFIEQGNDYIPFIHVYKYDDNFRLIADSINKEGEDRYKWENKNIIKCNKYRHYGGTYHEASRDEYEYHDNYIIKTSLERIGTNTWRENFRDSIVITQSPNRYTRTIYNTRNINNIEEEIFKYDEDGYLTEYEYVWRPGTYNLKYLYIYENGRTDDINRLFINPIKKAFNVPIRLTIE